MFHVKISKSVREKKDVAAATWLVMGNRVSSVGLVIFIEKLHLEE